MVTGQRQKLDITLTNGKETKIDAIVFGTLALFKDISVNGNATGRHYTVYHIPSAQLIVWHKSRHNALCVIEKLFNAGIDLVNINADAVFSALK